MDPASLPLRGKVILVTGAGRGAGRTIARRLASAGGAVGLLARTREQLAAVQREIESAGGRAVVLPADVADETAVGQAVADLAATFGGIDALVNNAGVGRSGPTASYALSDWNAVIGTNLTGAFVCSRAVYPHLRARGGGAIVAISSGAGRQGYPRMAAYCASKFGLNGLMQALAAEWGDDRIKVATISPGTIATDFGSRTAAQRQQSGKTITPDDLAGAVLFLLTQSDRAWTQDLSLWPF